MACRGVFFALNSSEKEHLLALGSDAKRLEYIQEEVEVTWDETHLLEMDKAWDAIHRCLTNGTLNVSRVSNPMGKLIAGGIQLYSDPESYIINLTENSELLEVSAALKTVTKEWLKARYDQLRSTDYPRECFSEQDWEYTWEYFSDIPDFVGRAFHEGRSIVFTVDQ